MKKTLLGIAVLVALGFVGSLWWLSRSLDSQVASAIRVYGSEIAGVPVSLSDVRIVVADGAATLHGLVVGNPPGFKTAQALSLDEVTLKLDVGSLATDVIRIKEMSIVKPDITYEYTLGGSNLDVLQRNADRYVAGHGYGKSESREGAPGKKLVIEHVYIKNGIVNVSADMLNGKAVVVPLPDLQMTDIGKQSNGATVGEAMKNILGALTQSVTASVGTLNLGTVADGLKKGAEAATDAIRGLFK
ncbi:MAG: hypothetical protein BVN29_18200 [Nitrospira sp. ST-bin5]|nr:MAG: hypothetical protein BVN29_18200 [Nitrospira sp. ST-bin5]